jgi:plastocyanin
MAETSASLEHEGVAMGTLLRLTLPVALLAAACGGGGGAGDDTGDDAVPADTLVMSDNAFEPQSWSISPGTYTLDNQGQALHNLTVEEGDIDVDVQAGQTQDIDIDLAPGEYDMVCKYHVAQGMTGTLVVEES